MNKLSISEQATVIRSLVEGNSIASTVRMTGVAKTTILRLMIQLADACQKHHDDYVKGLTSKRIQMDEVWAFVGAKEKNASFEKKAKLQWGDAWTWTAIDADTKLMVSWLIGPRHAGSANSIMRDVAWRMTHRIQLTTDGLRAYWDAAGNAFHCEVDYAQLIKLYGPEFGDGKYSPPQCNGHSKKIENHIAMSTIWFAYYNWCRIHQTLRVTPAMAAGLTTRLWEVEDLIGLLK